MKHIRTPEDLEAERRAGLLVCQCEKPVPVQLLLFGGGAECTRCGKLIEEPAP